MNGCSPVVYESEDEKLYDRGYLAYSDSAYQHQTGYLAALDTAIELFNRVITDHPYSSKVDNAQYFLGKTHIDYAQHCARSSDTTAAVEHYKRAPLSLEAIDAKSNYYVDGLYYAAHARLGLNEIQPGEQWPDQVIQSFFSVASGFAQHSRAAYSLREIGHIYRRIHETSGEAAAIDSAAVYFQKVVNNYTNHPAYSGSLYWAATCFHNQDSMSVAAHLYYTMYRDWSIEHGDTTGTNFKFATQRIATYEAGSNEN